MQFLGKFNGEYGKNCVQWHPHFGNQICALGYIKWFGSQGLSFILQQQ